MAQAFVSFVATFANAKELETGFKALGCRVVQDEHYVQILVLAAAIDNTDTQVLDFAHETILDKQTLRVVSFGLPKTKTMTLSALGSLANPPNPFEISGTVVKVGSMVRVFYCTHTQMWRITSSEGGVFDAHKHFGYDCPHSLGELFERCLGRIYDHQMLPFNELPIADKLDKDKTYHFLFQHKGLHRDFVQHPTLFIVAVFVPQSLVFLPPVADKLPTLQDIVFKNTSELIDFVREMSDTDSTVVGVTFTVAGKCFKTYTDRYIRDMELLGHVKTSNVYLTSNLYTICLLQRKSEEFLDRFPSFGTYVKQIKVWLNKLAEMIMGGFNKRLSINNSHVQALVKELHDKKLYQTNHLNVKYVTFEIVNSFLDNVVGSERINVIFNVLGHYQTAPAPAPAAAAAAAVVAPVKVKKEAAAAAAAPVKVKKEAAAAAAAPMPVKKEEQQVVAAPAAAAPVPVKKEEQQVVAAPVAAPAAAAPVPVKKEPQEQQIVATPMPPQQQQQQQQQQHQDPTQLRKKKAYLKGVIESFLSQKIALAPPYDTLFIVSRMMEMPLKDLQLILSDKWALSDFIDKYYTQLRNGLEEQASQMRLTPNEVAYFQMPPHQQHQQPAPAALERKKAAYVRDFVVMPYLCKKYTAMPAMPSIQPFDMLFIVFRLLDMEKVALLDEWTLMSTLDKFYNELRVWLDESAQEKFFNIKLSATDIFYFKTYFSPSSSSYPWTTLNN